MRWRAIAELQVRAFVQSERLSAITLLTHGRLWADNIKRVFDACISSAYIIYEIPFLGRASSRNGQNETKSFIQLHRYITLLECLKTNLSKREKVIFYNM